MTLDPFSATLEPDPALLRDLRMGIASWLGSADIEDGVRDAVVIATHEAAASAIEHSSAAVTVDAQIEERSISVVVESDGGWTSPEDDEGGHRMHIIRGVVSKVCFDAEPEHASLRFDKHF
jgi:hypothetical protein